METLAQLLKKGEEFLARKGVAKPRLEAQIIFSKVLSLSRIALYTQDKRPMTPVETEELRNLLVRKAGGEPTAYLTGTKEFYSREFAVNSHTLIPRPETEELCDLVLSHAGDFPSTISILDMATGTGCIGITLALELKRKGFLIERLLMVDVSEMALERAAYNADNLLTDSGIEFSVLQSNWFEKVGGNPEFDIIVSNPPYIPTDEYQQLDTSVKNFEPEVALHTADYSGIIKTLGKGASIHLKPNSWLFLEINPGLADETLMSLSEFSNLSAEKTVDLASREHFIKARKTQ